MICAEDDGEREEPLDMSWPQTTREKLTYVALAPIVVPLWLTLPDVRRPVCCEKQAQVVNKHKCQESRKWYPFSFMGSIIWIAIYSYLMVWWANTIGETYNVPIEVRFSPLTTT